MSDIPAVKSNIQTEAVQFRAAVSESILNTVGGSINFINTKQYDTKAYFINGPYNGTGVLETAVDGLYIVPPGINATIFAVSMYNIVAGSGGTTTLDVLRATSSGGAFTTIFSTKPAIASSAGNNAYIATGGSGSGLTAPVLTGTTFNLSAGDALRLDFTGKQTGSPENCGLILYTYPR
jgi:hypothetical protein